MDAQSPFDGWKACLAWILHMDPESLEEQEQMIVARRDQQRRAEERRKLERQQLRELRKAGKDTLTMALENGT
jgi:4-alpha-glucanotransferase